MKFVIRISTFLLSILLLASLLVCAVSAEQTDWGTDNLNAAYVIQEKIIKLNTWYTNKVALGWSDTSIAVIRGHLRDCEYPLIDLKYVTDRSTAEEMELIYQRGAASCLLTWIYYSDEELHRYEAITGKYNELIGEVNAEALSFFTTPDTDQIRTAEDCYNELIAAMYAKKLQNIETLTPEDPDSAAVKGILSDAIFLKLNELNFRSNFYCYYNEGDESFGRKNDYLALYDRTLEQVNIQRNREAVTAQLEAIFPTLYPGENFNTTQNPRVIAFQTAIGQKDTVGDMNAILKDTVNYLLNDLIATGNEENDQYKGYRQAYLQALAQEVTATVADDTERNEPAQITHLFSQFENDLKKADTKDELVKYATETIKADHPAYGTQVDELVAQYTADGGILDRADASNLELELERAKRRLDLLVEYNQALEQIDAFLGSSPADVADFATLADELTAEYDSASAAIAASGATLRPADILSNAKETFADTVAEAEACAFENAHATIIGITQEQIDTADAATLEQYKDLLDAAIGDANGTAPGDTSPLSDAAIAKLEARTDGQGQPTPVLTNLGSTYREIVQAQIEQTLSGNAEESETIQNIRQETVEQQKEKVENLPCVIDPDRGLEDLNRLPDAANDLLEEAEQVDSVLDHYTNNIDPSVQNGEMEEYCDQAAQEILNGTQTAEDAITELNRMEAEELIHQAADGHTNVDGVQDILDRVAEDLDSLTTEEQIDDYVEDTIFQIENCVTAETIRQEIQETEDRINDMDFLDEEQKQSYLEQTEKLEEYLPTIENATDKDTQSETVNDAINDFTTDLDDLDNTLDCIEDGHNQYQDTVDSIDRAENVDDTQKNQWKEDAEDHYNNFLDQVTNGQTDANTAQSTLTQQLLALEQNAATGELTEIANALVAQIQAYKYLDPDTKNAHSSALLAKKDEFCLSIGSATSAAEVAELLRAGLSALHAQAATALSEEKEACCRILSERLANSYAPAEYSPETQLVLSQLVQDYTNKLNADLTVEENEATYAEAIGAIRATDNLLLDAQKRNEAKLTETYNSLLSRSECYSDNHLATLHSTYEAALAEIRAPRAIADWQKVDVLTVDAINTLHGIPLDRVYTEDKLLTDDTRITAPDAYDPANNGYVGKVEAIGGLPYDTVLTVIEGDPNGVVKKLKQAAKGKQIYPADGSVAGKDLLRRLKDTQICAALDIQLATSLMQSASKYTVSVLLPEALRGEDILGVVFLREDGSAEFYEITRDEDRITFETSHFSEFYVIRENIVNLMPWIIVLCIIIACEALALLLLYLRKNLKSSGAEVLSSIALPSTVLTVYRPIGGVWVLWILGAIALALAGWIAWLVATELRGKYPEADYPEEDPDQMPKKKEFPTEETVSEPEEIQEEETETVALPEPEEDTVSELEDTEELPTLEGREATPALEGREATPALEGREAAPALEGKAPSPALGTIPKRLLLAEPILPEVTAEEAEELMPDEIAKEELENGTESFIDIEVYTGTKKAEINIDTISQNFEDGDIVTLNALKDKKLVKKNVGHVKILARGTLDKPLTVIAQDFSTAALKMILLTGGMPVVTKPSPQRSGKK